MNARRPARACGLVLPLLLVGGWASGCGDSPAQRPVRLEITAPADAAVVHDGRVEVRGLVKPRGARVVVLGRRARVARGEFSVVVPLREGSNLIDVGASARGASPAWNALRVTREVPVNAARTGRRDPRGCGRRARCSRPSRGRGGAGRPAGRTARGRLDRLRERPSRGQRRAEGERRPPHRRQGLLSPTQGSGVAAMRPTRGRPSSRCTPKATRPVIGSLPDLDTTYLPLARPIAPGRTEMSVST